MIMVHTPGPWLFRGKSDTVHKPSNTHPFGDEIFRFNDDSDGPSDADLSLILAAPYLLDALKKIINFNIQYCIERYGDESKAESMACVVVARAAIAKAEGENHENTL